MEVSKEKKNEYEFQISHFYRSFPGVILAVKGLNGARGLKGLTVWFGRSDDRVMELAVDHEGFAATRTVRVDGHDVLGDLPLAHHSFCLQEHLVRVAVGEDL